MEESVWTFRICSKIEGEIRIWLFMLKKLGGIEVQSWHLRLWIMAQKQEAWGPLNRKQAVFIYVVSVPAFSI